MYIRSKHKSLCLHLFTSVYTFKPYRLQDQVSEGEEEEGLGKYFAWEATLSVQLLGSTVECRSDQVSSYLTPEAECMLCREVWVSGTLVYQMWSVHLHHGV